jgi:hypothetical protein
MKAKFFYLFLIAAACAVGCGEENLNKDFKPVGKDAPMPTATGAGAGAASSGPTNTAPKPP